MERENNEPENVNIREKIKENLDLIIASGGVLLGIFIIYLSLAFEIHQQDIGGTVLIASVLYILLRKRLLKASETFEFKPSRKFVYFNNIIFFLALSLSVWLLYTTLYSRPLIYFVLVAVACASIALEILYSNNKKWAGLILIKVLLIGITLYGGIYYEFSDIIGVDTHIHNAIVETYIETGHDVPYISSGEANVYNNVYNVYYYFPMFHTLAAETGILTSLNVYDSIFSSMTFLFVFSVIFVFLIGQKLINTKVGLLAALMLVFGDYRIAFGSAPIPMTFGVVFFTIILYLFIISMPKPLYKRSIAFILFIVLVLTHTIAGFVTFVTAISLLIWKNLNRLLSNISTGKFTILWSTVVVFGILLIGYWMYAFQRPEGMAFFDEILSSLYRSLTLDAEFAVDITKKVSPYVASSFFEYFLDNFGYLIFLGFGILGTYIWLRDKNEFKIPLCLTMIVLFAVLYGFPLMGLRNILPTRWFSFVYVILAVVSVYGIFKLMNLINKKFAQTSIVIIIFLISFFMIASTISNDDNPLYHKEHSYRTGHKASELQGIATVHQIFNKTVQISAIYLVFNVPCTSLNPDVISQDYNFSKDEGEMYVIRKDAFKYPMVNEKIRLGISTPHTLDEEFKTRLELNSNKIYDNGEVWGHIIKENF